MSSEAVLTTKEAKSLTRSGRSRSRDILTSCVHLRPISPRDTTGPITGAALIQRVGYGLDLVQQEASVLLNAYYNPASLALLTSGVGPDDRPLPRNAFMAARRLGWVCTPREGTYLPDRFRRIIEEVVVRRLRQAIWTSDVILGIVSTWPEGSARSNEEWDALHEALPGVDKVTIRNRTRQIAAFLKENGALPNSLFELEPMATAGPVLLLAATDQQFHVLTQTPSSSYTHTTSSTASLQVKLPTCPFPASPADWAFVSFDMELPPYLMGRSLTAPSIRLEKSRVIVDQPTTESITPVSATGHEVGIGADWGVNTLLTAATGYIDSEGAVHSDGRPMSFSPDGAVSKVHRLRRQREILSAKVGQIKTLLESTTSTSNRGALENRVLVLEREISFINARQRNLNKAIAVAGARWLVDQALANGASVIYLEDLATMESRGLGTKNNTRAANTVRTHLLAMIRHLGARAGIAVVVVPAKGTSAQCPKCLHDLTHLRSPRDWNKGHSWTRCENCDYSANRDHSAAVRILSRGLASQSLVHTILPQHHLVVRKVVDVKVRRQLRARVSTAKVGSKRQARYMRTLRQRKNIQKVPTSLENSPTTPLVTRVVSSDVSPRTRLTRPEPVTAAPTSSRAPSTSGSDVNGRGLQSQRPTGTHRPGLSATNHSASEVDVKKTYRAYFRTKSVAPGCHGFPQRLHATPIIQRGVQ